MDYLFWGLAITMVLAATSFIVLPLHKNRQTLSKPLLIMMLLIPLSAIGLYSAIGSPGKVSADKTHADLGQSPYRTMPARNAGKPADSVASLVGGLAQRLQREPDDAKGWLLLARSYEHLGRHRETSAAYERASALGNPDPALEALLRSDGGPTVQSAEATQFAIRGRLSIDRAAGAIVEDTDTVFIFAKASKEQRMPVVAVRKSVADLPIDFVLTDKLAMVPGTSLADFDELFVTARISRSGLANDAVAGLEIEGQSVSPLAGELVQLTVRPLVLTDNDAEVPAE